MRAIYQHLLAGCLLLTLIHSTSAASPTSFCKCTCFTNSTIIPLDAPNLTPPHRNDNNHHRFLLFPRESPQDENEEQPLPENPPKNDTAGKGAGDGVAGGDREKEEEEEGDRKEYRAGNCNDCNRQFCLDYNLPICKRAGMEDVFTTCFQRDSRKDEAVVFIFIFATVGLLMWAAVKPWVGKWIDSARERRSYIPMSGEGDT